MPPPDASQSLCNLTPQPQSQTNSTKRETDGGIAKGAAMDGEGEQVPAS